MLFENEISDFDDQERPVDSENVSPQEETPGTEEPKLEDPTPSQEAESQAESAPTHEEEAESPADEGPSDAREDAPSSEEPAAEPPAVQVAFETDVEIEPLEQKVTEILSSDNRTSLLQETPPEALVALLQHYVIRNKIQEDSSKVGLVKRTFDAIRASEAIDEGLVNHFRNFLAEFNRLRTETQRKINEEKAQNAARKKELLEKLSEIIASEDVHRIKEVREIQDQWKGTGHVPKKEMDDLYKNYRILLDKFYQRREMHFELLEYDRKINLQEKEKLIEEAKQLVPPEEDRENLEVWRQKMELFGEIQQQWRSIGHVPREDMERIREEFRGVIDKFFEARQQYLELEEKAMEGNGEKKKALLAEMEPFVHFEAGKPREWNDATQQLRKLQETWKQMGRAPVPLNNELWQKYREIADAFFSKKSAFFKELDQLRSENLEKKQALCEQAENLKESSDWEKAAKTIKQLQRDWKAIGPVPERHSNKLWNRFKGACDGFFENRRQHYKELHADEHENLDKKRALIDAVKVLVEAEELDVDEAVEKIKEYQREWKTIGRVPYKEKDKIWDEFRKEIDTFFNGLSLKRDKLREVKLKTSIDSIPDMDERSKQIKGRISRIRRKVQAIETKIEQYSTNMLFIAKGKSGDPLRKQIQEEVDREKTQLEELHAKIALLKEMLKNPPEELEEEKEEAEEVYTDSAGAQGSEGSETPDEEEAGDENDNPESEPQTEEQVDTPPQALENSGEAADEAEDKKDEA